MGADKNLSQSEAWLMIPKYTSNPNVLGEVRCSYGKATPTQNNLSNKRDKSRKQTRRSSVRECTVYEHRLNRQVKKVFTSLTDVTEPAARQSKHWLIRRIGLNSVGSTGDSTPDDPTKSI